jgi:hypothetical protein
MARLQTVHSECSSLSWMSIAPESQYTMLPVAAARMMSRAPCASTAARQSALYGSTPHARASSRMGTCGVATVESGYVPYCIFGLCASVLLKSKFSLFGQSLIIAKCANLKS